MTKQTITLNVNGASVSTEAEPRELLIHVLREQLEITGPHIGCETSHCGACTVDIDGMSVKSCTMFAVQAQRASRIAMRLLHAGYDYPCASFTGGKPQPDRGRCTFWHCG